MSRPFVKIYRFNPDYTGAGDYKNATDAGKAAGVSGNVINYHIKTGNLLNGFYYSKTEEYIPKMQTF